MFHLCIVYSKNIVDWKGTHGLLLEPFYWRNPATADQKFMEKIQKLADLPTKWDYFRGEGEIKIIVILLIDMFE